MFAFKALLSLFCLVLTQNCVLGLSVAAPSQATLGMTPDDYEDYKLTYKAVFGSDFELSPNPITSHDKPAMTMTQSGQIVAPPTPPCRALFTKAQLDALLKNKGSNRKKRTTAISYQPWFWPSGYVPFRFDNTEAPFSPYEKEMIKGAMREWMRKTAVQFQEVSQTNGQTTLFITRGNPDQGCLSFIGKTAMENQYVWLGEGCLYDIARAVHELGHALGLDHEQNRIDRNAFLDVQISNLKDQSFADAYAVVDPSTFTFYNLPFDYHSDMMYGPTDFARPGLRIMNALDPIFTPSLGQRTGLSFLDAKVINIAYGFAAARCAGTTLARACANGGYQDPNNCQQCSCPSGLNPPYCENTTAAANGCFDKSDQPLCDYWKQTGLCDSTELTLDVQSALIGCAKTCQRCKANAGSASCADKDPSCASQASTICQGTDSYGMVMCTTTCSVCSDAGPCGGELLAPVGANPTSFILTSPGYNSPWKAYNGNEECNWLIKVPSMAYQVSVAFVGSPGDFGVYCKASLTCQHWVEVRTKADFSIPGYRFCCTNVPPSVPMISEGTKVLITFRTSLPTFWRSQNNRGWKIQITTAKRTSQSS